jgi:hypothetical protein
MKRGIAKPDVNAAEPHDRRAELRLLAAQLHEELTDGEIRLSLIQIDNTIVIAYHHIVALYWEGTDGKLTCIPRGWRSGRYAAANAVRAREITIRLLFEFVREFGGDS